MGMLFSNSEFVECSQCKGREFYRKDRYAYQVSSVKGNSFYTQVYTGTDLECAVCGKKIKSITDSEERIIKNV